MNDKVTSDLTDPDATGVHSIAHFGTLGSAGSNAYTGYTGYTGSSGADVSQIAVRLVGALLALAVAAAHVADQGGISSFTSPNWIGWGYRLIEAGSVLTALALILPRPAWTGWLAGLVLGAGPFIAYVTSRAVGVPGDLRKCCVHGT